MHSGKLEDLIQTDLVCFVPKGNDSSTLSVVLFYSFTIFLTSLKLVITYRLLDQIKMRASRSNKNEGFKTLRRKINIHIIKKGFFNYN